MHLKTIAHSLISSAHSLSLSGTVICPRESLIKVQYYTIPLFDNLSGTVFRFPLRTEQQAVNTELRPLQQYNTAQVQQLLDEFAERASSVLLYLNSVQSVELWEWSADQSAPFCALKVELLGADACDRGVMNDWLKHKLDAWSQVNGVPWKTSPGVRIDVSMQAQFRWLQVPCKTCCEDCHSRSGQKFLAGPSSCQCA